MNSNFWSNCLTKLITGTMLVTLAACSANVNSTTTAKTNFEVPEESNFERGLNLVENARDRFDYPKAAEFLEMAVAEDAGNVEAQYWLLYAYVQYAQFGKAKALLPNLRSRRELITDKVALWFDALAARVEDNSSEEITAWSALTAAYPDDRWAWYQLGAAYSFVERYAEAAKAVERALDIEPDPQKWSASWIYYLHSKSLFRSGNYSAAVKAAEPAEATPVVWRASFYRYALAKVKSGQADKVAEFAEEYRRISRAEGINSDFITEGNIGLLFYELDEYDKAIEQFRLAMSMGENASQYTNLGYNLVFAGRNKEALIVLEEGIAKFPQNPLLTAAYGWALFSDGQVQAARDALVHAKSLSMRSSYRIEKDLAAVEGALRHTGSPRPAYRPWLD